MSQAAGAAAIRLRDEGRSRARSLTWWAAVGAAAVTAVGAAIAASTVPGRTLDQSQSTAPPSGTGGGDPSGGSGATDPGGSSDSGGGSIFQGNPPPQVAPGRGSPFAVTGGS